VVDALFFMMFWFRELLGLLE